MQKKLTFKEYYESKERLKEASQSVPKTIVEYTVKKYCKLPILTEKNDKGYLSLKPKDGIKILWEFNDIKKPAIRAVIFESQTYTPSWNNEKMKNWITATIMEKGNK